MNTTISCGASAPTSLILIEEILGCYGQAPCPPRPPYARAATLGRVRALRVHGRMAFVDLVHNGQRLQVGFRNRSLPSEAIVGAWLEVEGEVYPSQAGELTLWAERSIVHQLPTRPLEAQPLQGTAPEQRLLLDPGALLEARARSRMIQALRQALWQGGYEEVETPILHRSASGAAARPFATHSRALEQDMALRVAPEPHLIRLMAAGFARIFEIARAFRNEGVSPRHQPEFSLMEVYAAGVSLESTTQHCHSLVLAALEASGVNVEAAPFRGHLLNWRQMRVATLCQLVEEHTGCASAQACQLWLRERGQTVPLETLEAWSAVFEQAVEPCLIQPTFVTQWPASISPLALSEDGEWARRFELYAGGMELANGFEQNRDEILQRQRFSAQARRAGEGEVMAADEDYLFAMGWGLPPIGGFGIGVDRLVMMGLGVDSIREAVLFPM